jgi:hypothetical protein
MPLRKVVSVAAFLSLVAGCNSPSTKPVTLTGARLESIRDERVTWKFGESGFEVEHEGRPIPADVAESILGPGVKASAVKGKWRVEGNTLVLSDMTADGQQVEREAPLSLQMAGNVRVNLGSRQYNVFR